MTEVLIAAIGTTFAVIGLVNGLRPRHATASAVLEAAYRPRREGSIPAGDPRGSRATAARAGAASRRTWRPHVAVARPLVAHLEDRSSLPAELISWCAAADRTTEEVTSQVVLGVLCGVLVSLAVGALATASRERLPLVVPAWVAALSILGGALVPVISLRAEARASGRAARAVISSFLDLVTLCLAGGMGIEGALHAAAGVAQDRLSGRLRKALSSARDRGESPWQALADLGHELRIDELAELSAAVALAGTEGARIRSTLSAKAAWIRRHQLSDAEAEANTITERLFLPGMFLLFGFLLFVGYPAVSKILGGF